MRVPRSWPGPPGPRDRRDRDRRAAREKSAMIISPTNLSTVPLFVNTIGTMVEKYSIQLADDRFGFAAFGHRGETADVGKENRHVSARSAETSIDGARHQLIVHILRDVARKEPSDAPLLAAFDKVPDRRRRRTSPAPSLSRARRAAPTRLGRTPPSNRRRGAIAKPERRKILLSMCRPQP